MSIITNHIKLGECFTNIGMLQIRDDLQFTIVASKKAKDERDQL